jgi:predicted metal-dependent peptidase
MKTVEQRIERAHLSIMKHPSFVAWSGLLFVGNWSVEDNPAKCPTAYVNAAGDVKYGREFVDGLPTEGSVDVYLNFVILHETGHKALLHLVRGKKLFEESQMLANIAADHVVNNMILESDPNGTFARMPRKPDGADLGCCDPKYKGWGLKQVYDDLKKGAKEGGKGAGGAMDDHDPNGEAGELSEAQTQQIEQAVENALRSGAYLAGKMGGTADRTLGALLEPKIDWREQTAEFVQEIFTGDDEATWRRPMRRFVGDDLYLPSYHQEAVGEMLFAVDVSGSVVNAAMTACLSEVVGACRVARPAKLHLWYWDCGIRRREEYLPEQYDDIVRLTRPTGGGGTDLEEVAKEANKMENLQCAVILTDGYISGGWRTWNTSVLWVLTTRNMLADCGKSLYIDVD